MMFSNADGLRILSRVVDEEGRAHVLCMLSVHNIIYSEIRVLYIGTYSTVVIYNTVNKYIFIQGNRAMFKKKSVFLALLSKLTVKIKSALT